jgi:hypothetical protein
MPANYHKIASNLNTDLYEYFDTILADIPCELSNDEDSPQVLDLDVPNHIAYWQYYPYTGTRFTRNFGRRFPKIAKNIVNQLIAIQSSIKKEKFEDQKMYHAFVNHKFNHERVQLTKITSGVGVLPHYDHGREYVINIGVRNSNTCKVYIANNKNIEGFLTETLKSFVIEDNEAFIINVDKAHAVKTLVKAEDKLDRYLITYMLTAC